MKKIGLNITPMLGQKTGIGWYTYKIIEKLIERNKNIYIGEVFNFYRRHDINKIRNNIKKIEIEENIFFPRRLFNKLNYIFSYNLFFKKKKEIYHFFSFKIPKKIKGKVVVTIHDMIYKIYPETTQIKNMDKFDKEINHSIIMSDKIIAVSEATKKDILRYFNISEKKIEVIYPGVEDELYKTYIFKKQSIKKYKIGTKYILFLGTLEPRKNIVNIIKSFERANLKEIKLVITGGKGWKYEEIFEAYKNSPCKDKIQMLDYIAEEDKIALYKGAELFIFPSLYEGFGMPVLEAMAAGTPVITSNISSLPEVAGDAAILVNPYDIDEISKAIKNIIGDEVLKKEMIRKGLEQAKKFTWENSVKKLEKIYSEL